MQRKLEDNKNLSEVLSSQRKAKSRTLTVYEAGGINRNESIVNAYRSGGYTIKVKEEFYGFHYFFDK
jgi:hypothetical protein